MPIEGYESCLETARKGLARAKNSTRRHYWMTSVRFWESQTVNADNETDGLVRANRVAGHYYSLYA